MTTSPDARRPVQRLLLFALVLVLFVPCAVAAATEYQFFTSFGTWGTGDGEFYGPIGIAVNGTGYIYVTDEDASRVQCFTPSYGFVSAFGVNGSGPGELYYPEGVAVNASGYVYVVDHGNARVQVFTPSGGYAGEFGTYGSGPGEFDEPFGIAVDRAGTVYVADSYNDRIQVFSPSGAFVREILGDTGPSLLYEPCGVAIGPDGNVYVADTGNSQVQVFTPPGAFVRAFPVFTDGVCTFPCAIATGPGGEVVVSEECTGRVDVLTPTGTRTATLRLPPPTGSPFSVVPGLGVTPSGHILVADYLGSRVVVFRPISSGPTAAFSAYPETGRAPLAVQFSDLSDGAASWLWAFGDGSYSTIRNPAHVYDEPGSYTVSLMVSDSQGRSASKVAPGLITVTGAPPTADFSANRTTGTAPLAVAFTANTTVATSWQWFFGDGTTSTDRNPVHVYGAPGTYTVWLVASAPGYGAVTACKERFVRVADTLEVDFGANITSGAVPLTVGFSDLTVGAPFAWRWEFGDGASSNQRNAIHTYTQAGTYTVNLTAWTAHGSATASKPAFVTVGPDPRAPVANFSMSRTSGAAPLYVRFSDTSTGNPTSWRWDFGGLAWTGKQHPTAIFRQAGTYAVTLTATNAYGSSTFTRNLSVTGTSTKGARDSAVDVVG
jgi:PKD repeat protein